jgi:DNA (cytosine-5)-methyltransferase 1
MTQVKKIYSLDQVAHMLDVNKETLRRWDKTKKLIAHRHPINGYRFYTKDQLEMFEQLELLNIEIEDSKLDNIKPLQTYNSIELFAGAGGLALGLEQAGIKHSLLNELDKWACNTLRTNRPNWKIIEGDIKNINFSKYRNKIDVLTGGFPCQAFSFAGKKLGLDDARGTLFFEYARALKEIKPKICVAENVRGLLNHENGRTLAGMISVLKEIGYTILPPRVLKAIYYNVPQKRERLVIVAIRNDIKTDFYYPTPSNKIYNLKDALKKGELYNTNVPDSPGQKYPERKKEILDMIPPGGYWRDLPIEIQKEYMLKSFYLGGGKTGMARRISWDEPCLTLTCAPAQKQTERCHPEETRPFTVREYARIQTFPDEWIFSGSVSQQYKQIGNAVPVNFAKKIGLAIVDFLNRDCNTNYN